MNKINIDWDELRDWIRNEHCEDDEVIEELFCFGPKYKGDNFLYDFIKYLNDEYDWNRKEFTDNWAEKNKAKIIDGLYEAVEGWAERVVMDTDIDTEDVDYSDWDFNEVLASEAALNSINELWESRRQDFTDFGEELDIMSLCDDLDLDADDDDIWDLFEDVITHNSAITFLKHLPTSDGYKSSEFFPHTVIMDADGNVYEPTQISDEDLI